MPIVRITKKVGLRAQKSEFLLTYRCQFAHSQIDAYLLTYPDRWNFLTIELYHISLLKNFVYSFWVFLRLNCTNFFLLWIRFMFSNHFMYLKKGHESGNALNKNCRKKSHNEYPYDCNVQSWAFFSKYHWYKKLTLSAYLNCFFRYFYSTK